MSINFQEILKELEYRVEHGIIDLTKEEQVTKLTEILKENAVSDATEMAQKARVYFSYINEATKKQPLDKVLSQTFVNPETDRDVTVASALGYDKNKKAYGIAQSMMRTAGYSNKDIDMVDAGPDDEEKPKSSVFGKDKGGKVFEPTGKEKPQPSAPADPKKVKAVVNDIYKTKRGTIMGDAKDGDNQVKNDMIKYGYNGYQKATGKKPAPGGAGSAFNEIISCEGAKILAKYPDLNEEELTRVLVAQYCGTALAKEQSLTAEVNGALPKDLKNNACASKALVCARSARSKYEGIKTDVANLQQKGLLGKPVQMNSFYGAEDSKAGQIDILRKSKRIFAPDGTEIKREDAIAFVAAGGGGANPSDTSIFTTDGKGNVLLNFFSDKTSTADIQDNSTLVNEINDKFTQIKSLQDAGIIKPKEAATAVKMLAEHAKKVNAIEETYSNSTQTIASNLIELANKKVKGVSINDQSMALNGKKGTKDKTILKNFEDATTMVDRKTKKTIVRPELLPYLPKDANPAKPTQEQLLIAVNRICAKEGGNPAQQKIVNKISKILNDEFINAGVTPPDGIDVNNTIGVQRKKVVESHHDLFRNLDQTKIKVGGVQMGLGTFLQSQDVIKSFHLKMMDAPPKKYEPGNPESLVYSCFNVNMGGTVVNGQVMRECMGAKNTQDFEQNFSVQESKEFTYEYSEKDAREQLARKGVNKPTPKQLQNARNVTGMKIFTYALNKKDGSKIDVGYRTYRAKTGKTGKTNTTMQYSPQMQNCFKSKSNRK
jgi:hypothetical protein